MAIRLLQQGATINSKKEVTYQINTTNKYFMDMYYYLKNTGHENCKFHLVLYDEGLMYINPRDPNLPRQYKERVMIECARNFWYFCREIVRIPVEGGATGDGKQYELHRGNLALNFGFLHNWNMFAEFPRQHGKTVAALVWYLWLFLFGTRGSDIMFFNKRLEDSKMNLERLRKYREALPAYLQFNQVVSKNGKLIKPTDNVTTLENPYLNNKIKAAPSARTKIVAASLGRGCTIPLLYWDEYAFIPYNYIIYQSAIPAFSRASRNARMNNSPYGILITTTPGDLLTEEGKDAFQTKEDATKFTEDFYDKSPQDCNAEIRLNRNSNFVYIRYDYKQLGSGEDYFNEMVIELKKKAADIQREVLLMWMSSATNSPFEPYELDAVKNYLKAPIKEIPIYRTSYRLLIYKAGFIESPPLIGVDVSGGYSRDASAITVLDSKTTELIALFNCNYISIIELGWVIVTLIRNYMPTAIVNIERNGGFGTALLQFLLQPQFADIKKNLYYEFKDRVVEEPFDGYRRAQRKRKMKVYGFDETEKSRYNLMELLKERMHYHKDKFTAQIIYDQLCQLEEKTGGRSTYKYGPRIEHMDNGHDDQIFSYLLALYLFYHGENLRENFGFSPGTLQTENDDPLVDEYITQESVQRDITMEVISENDEHVSHILKEQQDLMADDGAKFIGVENYLDFVRKQDEENLYNQMQTNPLLKKSYVEKYKASELRRRLDSNTNMSYQLPSSTFDLGNTENFNTPQDTMHGDYFDTNHNPVFNDPYSTKQPNQIIFNHLSNLNYSQEEMMMNLHPEMRKSITQDNEKQPV